MELHLRAHAIGAEIKRLRDEAHQAGDADLFRKLRAVARASDLGDDDAGYTSTVDTLKGRLTPQVAAALEPSLRRQAEQRAADLYAERSAALDSREAELEQRPRSRTPWVAAGALPGVVLTTIIHAVV